MKGLPTKRDVIVSVVKLSILALLAYGLFSFYNSNNKNLTWCISKGEYCSIARLQYQSKVAQEIQNLGK